VRRGISTSVFDKVKGKSRKLRVGVGRLRKYFTVSAVTVRLAEELFSFCVLFQYYIVQ
jgi:hypothetical protein